MRRAVSALIFAAILLSAGCAGQINEVESLTDRALSWLLGEEAPERDRQAVRPLATPTLAPGAGDMDIRPRLTPDADGALPTAALPTATPPKMATPTFTRPAEGAFAGEFAGTAYGDNDSTAPIALDLTHRSGQLSGTVGIGAGLEVAAGGLCGTIPVPPTEFRTEAPLAAESRRLETTATIPVKGFEIEVELVATLSDDGQVMTAEATMFTPGLCSRDPVIEATLDRK